MTVKTERQQYEDEHRAVAAAAERNGQAGTAALLRLAATGCKDPAKLRAAARAAREAASA